MLEILLLTIVLGLWQIVLGRLGGLPAWARSAIRGSLLLVVVAQATLYTWVTWRTRSVPVPEIGEVLFLVQTWTDRTHIGSALLLGAVTLLLGVLSVRRALGHGPRGD